ncbi:Cytochrome C' [Rhodospirillales bacterium URHD0017]|nr:Cytochrome C' [Rhodospirillales bacterium URHD0017]
MSNPRTLFAIAFAWMLTPIAAGGQASPPAAYRPGLGDLMTTTVQPRHLKVGLAGQEQNWPYVRYELHELEESLERVARQWPKWREVDIAGLVVGSTKEPMAAVDEAAKAGDNTRFTEAYGRLTAACNACHQSANVAMIVIQAPKGSPFTNQDFRPPRR